MSFYIPLPEPSPATREAQRIAAERAARAGGVHADVGQLWTRKADDVTVRILGRKATAWGVANTADEDDVFWVGLDELVDDFTHTGCDHDAACCTEHGTHTSPHMGCVLR